MPSPLQEVKRKRGGGSGSSRGGPLIPQELIFQVLKELPVKSLLRFKSVSKLWRSIIDDPQFVKQHLARSHTRPNGIKFLLTMGKSHYNNNEIYSVDVNPESGRGPAIHLQNELNSPHQCVNGLVCFHDHVWNPAPNQSVRLPPLDLTAIHPSVVASHKRISTTILFGYDGSINAYKVLKLCYIDFLEPGSMQRRHQLQCKVWTLGSTSAWRDFDVSNMPEFVNDLWLSIHKSYAIGDVVYCPAHIRLGFLLPLNDGMIFAFDVRQEKLYFLSLPVFGSEIINYRDLSLIDVRGHLGLASFKMSTIYISQRIDNEEGWRKEKLLLPREWIAWSPKKLEENSDHRIREGFTLVGSIATGEILFQLTQHLNLQATRMSYFCYNLESKRRGCFLS